MIDDLELTFEEYPDRGRHRRRRGGQNAQKTVRKRKKKRRGRGRTVLALFLALALLGGLGGVAWFGVDRVRDQLFGAPDYATAGTGEVTVEVQEGETLTEIGNTLYRLDVVKSAKAFIQATEAEPRSRNIEPGVYKLRKQMRASDALAMLLDVKNKLVNKVTIREGLASVHIYKALSEATGVPVEEFVAAAEDPIKLGVPEFWFRRTDNKPVVRSIEGFLFPATYEFSPGATAEEILRVMVGQFIQVATEIKFVETVERDRGGISPYEALIAASLAQAEAGVPEDLGKIARVAYNRVYRKQMALQFDVTVNYYWIINGETGKQSKEMTRAELYDANNPYSTHAHKGWPPTPIGNPGKAALEAAMSPEDGDWLFFVAIDKEGHSAFATTDAEHERNKRIACENGILTC